jgi:hypothetical protein
MGLRSGLRKSTQAFNGKFELLMTQITILASARRDLIQKRMAEALAIEQRPLLADLRKFGLAVSDVWELVNTRENYDSVIPLLADHLTKNYSDKTKNGIARALAVKQAGYLWDLFASEYMVAPLGSGRIYPNASWDLPYGYKSGLANALANTVTNKNLGELIAIMDDDRHGESRLILLRGVKRFRSPAAKAAVERFSLSSGSI